MDEEETRNVTSRLVGAHLNITSASVVTLVERLVSTGYLTREVDPRDRRARILHATEAARVMVGSGLQNQVNALLSAAGAFSEDELETVERYLRAVTEALGYSGPDHSRSN